MREPFNCLYMVSLSGRVNIESMVMVYIFGAMTERYWKKNEVSQYEGLDRCVCEQLENTRCYCVLICWLYITGEIQGAFV